MLYNEHRLCYEDSDFMKKCNRKGFLLAEAIIVGVFVLSLFTFLFVNIVPLVGKYESFEKYDTVEGTYNTHLIRLMILNSERAVDILKLGSRSYVEYEPDALCSLINDTNYCETLLGKNYLDVNKIYITWYGPKKIKESSLNFDRATRDYIDSLIEYNEPSFNNTYKRLIIRYNDDTFANIEMMVEEN